MLSANVKSFAKENGVNLRLHTMDGQWLLTARSPLAYKTVAGLTGRALPTERDLLQLVVDVASREATYTQGPVWDGSGFDF